MCVKISREKKKRNFMVTIWWWYNEHYWYLCDFWVARRWSVVIYIGVHWRIGQVPHIGLRAVVVIVIIIIPEVHSTTNTFNICGRIWTGNTILVFKCMTEVEITLHLINTHTQLLSSTRYASHPLWYQTYLQMVGEVWWFLCKEVGLAHPGSWGH